MATGLAAASANSRLNVFRGTSYTAPAAVYVQLHTGDPGAAGTANASAVTTRNTVTWNAPSGGSMTLGTLAAWSMTASETITHVSLKDAATAGNFIASYALSASKTVQAGDQLSIGTFTLSETPIAA